jgi:hypothetical protein
MIHRWNAQSARALRRGTSGDLILAVVDHRAATLTLAAQLSRGTKERELRRSTLSQGAREYSDLRNFYNLPFERIGNSKVRGS